MYELIYTQHDMPRIVDIRAFKIGPVHDDEDYDDTWIRNRGDIIIKIVCEDGIFILIREGYFEAKKGKEHDN